MRRHALLTGLLAAVALSCSSDDPSLTAARPGFSVTCPPPALVITATPSSSTTRPPNTNATATFLVTDNCTDGVDVGLTSSSSGAVISVGTPSPSFISLSSSQSVTVSDPYSVGASGTGTVVLGTKPTPSQMTGSLAVTVSGAAAGVPFGPQDLFDANGVFRQVAPFTFTPDILDSNHAVAQIHSARVNHVKFALVMTGGGHGQYLTNGKFVFAKWKNVQNKFNTLAIKAAVDSGVADGTIPYAVLMDEPNHPEGTPPVADWGGVMTHALLDSMSQYTKSIFPTLRTDVDITWTWHSTEAYNSVDVITTQYTFAQNDVNIYRDSAVASAKRQKVALVFSLNILNGGEPLQNQNPPCPTPRTGGSGTIEGGGLFGCKMTSTQVQNFGDALLAAPETCALKMWTWDLTTLTPTGDFMARSDNKAAFNHLAATAAAHAAKPCVKPS